MKSQSGSNSRRHLWGRAQAQFLGAVAIVSGLGLAFVAGALDGGIAKLRSWWEPAPTEIGPSDAPPTVADTSEAHESPGPTAAKSQVDSSVATLKKVTAYDRNEEALGALKEKRFDRAIELLQAAVDERPENAVYRANLGEAFLRRARSMEPGQFELAREDFEAAIGLIEDESRAGKVRALMERAKTIAHEEAEFSVEETLHFTFKFDASRTEIRAGVDRLQVLLEDTYQEYGDLFGRRPVEAGEKKIAVVLYRSEGFNKVTGLGDWAGGAFDGTIRVPADDLRDPRRVASLREVLRHEVGHAFTQSVGGREVPSWLNEGIAQWLENPERRQGGLKAARARLANAREKAGLGLFKLEEIQGSLVSWSDTSEITRAYDQAFAFVDYLVQQYGARLLFDLVAECKTGGYEGVGLAFERTILIDLDVVLMDFDAAL